MKQYQLSVMREAGEAYLEFLRTAHMSAGVYRLAMGEEDRQSPHNEEEVYFVVSGRARFEAEDNDRAVGPGDILFVPPKEPHHVAPKAPHPFYDIEEDLELLVVFSPPAAG